MNKVYIITYTSYPETKEIWGVYSSKMDAYIDFVNKAPASSTVEEWDVKTEEVEDEVDIESLEDLIYKNVIQRVQEKVDDVFGYAPKARSHADSQRYILYRHDRPSLYFNSLRVQVTRDDGSLRDYVVVLNDSVKDVVLYGIAEKQESQ